MTLFNLEAPSTALLKVRVSTYAYKWDTHIQSIKQHPWDGITRKK